MHRCLSIGDVVRVVCSHLEAEFAYHTLAILARTSCVFQSPALDFLWCYQSTLRNILQCLPTDLLTFDDQNADRERNRKVVVRLLRPIVSSDWDRARLYTHRVRGLDCDGDSLSLSQIFPALSISLPDDFLFPNLSELTWRFPEGDFHFINLCLARTLTEISIWPSSAFQLSILSTLPRRCPALKSLCIKGEVPPSASACLPLAQLPHLETLRIPADDFATLEVIGKLRNLTYLTLRNPPRDLASSIPPASIFQNTRQIDLLRVTPPAATEFLMLCTAASLTAVEVEFDSWPSTSALHQLHSALGVCHNSYLSLTSLIIDIARFSPVFEGDIVSHAVDSATLRILLLFREPHRRAHWGGLI
ncbi:hypothetical protein MVEN_01138200 [Mycena venus]|uniref:F-box domain-containing protein n=1 Tax=Mycena venus TaxID=2733690 RepID=A0A8H7CXS8_9AGAR|nr:hypothetical protein MVEN_01138200 [Mycena venus]